MNFKECTQRFLVTVAIDANIERAERFAKDTETKTQVFKSLADAIAANDNSNIYIPAFSTAFPNELVGVAEVLFDAVDIIVPHNIHEPLATEALRAGIHVILEKPISTSKESALRILEEGKKVCK